jgi:MerR family transcriptional regulator, copper efflux regulator
MSSQKLTVSQLARLAGVGPDSIRHYERIGLVPKAGRSSAGYRVWTAREVQYLKWVAPAKRAGFTLRELTEIFRMYRGGNAPCRTVQNLLRQKLADMDQKVDELTTLRAELGRVLVGWERRLHRASPGDFVPLFDDLHQVPITQSITILKRQSRIGEKS